VGAFFFFANADGRSGVPSPMSTSPQLATLDDLLAHAGWTRAMAVRLLGDSDEAEDVLQETWISALRRRPAPGGSLRPWLATVVRNLVRSRARSGTRARRKVEQLVHVSDAAAPSPEDLLGQLETERLIAAMVLNLPEPYRRTIIRRYHQGQSSAEIARAEGIAEGTVRWRLKQGIDDLRHRFEERAGGRTGARSVLLPLAAAAASAASATKGAFAAAAAPLLVVQVKSLLAAATVVAVVGAGVVAERAHDPDRRRPLATARRTAPDVAPRTMTGRLPAPVAPSSPNAAASLVPTATPADPITIRGRVRGAGAGRPLAAATVTMTPLGPGGAAPRTATTAAAGNFHFDDLPPGRFAITARVPGRPPSRVVIEVEGIRSVGSMTVSITPASAPSPAIAITVTPRGVPPGAPEPPAVARPQSDIPTGHSSWCCHRAIVVGLAVEGRACLKQPSEDTNPECELYGLKHQVTCVDQTVGQFATGDLKRTGRLVCDGLAL
jgi:RNA polymerase sigma factor (sigma-70 family)